MRIIASLAAVAVLSLPAPGTQPAAVFPGKDWERRAPADLGFDEHALRRLIPTYGIGGVIVRHGYLAASWGNPEVAIQTASMGKAFTGTLLGLAITDEKVKLDDPVWKTWTGEGELGYRYQYLNFGLNSEVTWRHMTTMTAGFPDEEVFVANGEEGDNRWNYPRRYPGAKFEYSDAGMWRFAQALTKLWHDDIRHVMQERIFAQIGVDSRRWDWLPGREVRENELYPEIQGYGGYLDPPYEIERHVVRGGPGWIVINSTDLARFGYLMLRNGRWNGKQLLSERWLAEAVKPQVRMSEVLDYGFNWWIYRGGRAFAARGISIGWAGISSLWVLPEYDLVISFIRTNLHQSNQKTAYEKNDWDEKDWPFQVAETIIHPER
jgi:CubicO group peptidase (beta-lactamase class C family)